VSYAFEPIGIVHSCFKEKFGIPRQAGLAPEAVGELEILPPYNRPEAFRELKDFSHLWLTFVFHAAIRDEWSPRVRPPRLGGNQRVGVFATRSPFRPNPIGLSLVRLSALDLAPNRVILELGGIDLLDGTPVLDIKPYLPYSDAIPDARAGFAPAPKRQPFEIEFTASAETLLAGLDETREQHLRRLIRQILANDPRPAYLHGSKSREHFGMRLYDFNIRWRVRDATVLVTRIEPVDSATSDGASKR
jgi:tRNA-Thr(GGU) m(6)t(6)A37 methyltransferase TsaA